MAENFFGSKRSNQTRQILFSCRCNIPQQNINIYSKHARFRPKTEFQDTVILSVGIVQLLRYLNFAFVSNRRADVNLNLFTPSLTTQHIPS